MTRRLIATVGVTLAAMLVAAPAPPALATSRHGESITVIFAGTPGAPGIAIARGAVFDIGSLTPSDSNTATLVFPDGTLLIQESGTTTVKPPTPPACIVRFTTTGTYRVVGGTGRFTGATGNGTSIDSGLELTTQSKTGCGDTALFLYDKIDIRGSLITR